ncbi:MAG: Rossmann-like and DUF2520 domain-containing protein [Candidatus Zhuqueibacterota bacterium]
MMTSTERIAVIGAGRLGAALSKALARLPHFRVSSIIDKDIQRAANCARQVNASHFSDTISELKSVDLIFVAVSDDAIPLVADDLVTLARGTKIAHFVFHTSGALSMDVFNGLRPFDIEIGSLHPIQTFAGRSDEAAKLQHIYFGIEGTEKGIARLIEMVTALNSNYLVIPADEKPLYHAACLFASNYVVALMKPVVAIFNHLGFDEMESQSIVYPLALNTLENMKENGLGAALTGPLSRGDIGTITRHIQLIKKHFPEYEAAYKELGRIALKFKSVQTALPAEVFRQIRQLLSDKDEDDD